MRTLSGALLALLLTASPAWPQQAGGPNQFYRYVDEQGVIHWAQSKHLIPEKYAAKATTPDFRDDTVFPSPKPYVKPATPPVLGLVIQHHPRLESLSGAWARETRRIVTKAWIGRGQDWPQPIIALYVNRDGGLTIPEIERSAGDFKYDLKARDTIIGLRRLPPLPQDFRGARVRVQIAFGFIR